MTTEWFSNDLLTENDIGMWVWGVDKFGTSALMKFSIPGGRGKIFTPIGTLDVDEEYGENTIIGWTPLIRPTTHTIHVAKRRPEIRGGA